MRRILILLYILVIFVMATATLVEKQHGTAYAAEHIYGAWWFSVLWALLAAIGMIWLLKSHVRRWDVWALHGALVLILIGALVTHLTSRQGYLHLRTGTSSSSYTTSTAGTPEGEGSLPFSVKLDTFIIHYYEGTHAARDFESLVRFSDEKRHQENSISMNHVARFGGYRFFQGTYDDDGGGCTLIVGHDPWGIGLTYTGYALLFLCVIWLLADPKGTFRRLLKETCLSKAGMPLLLAAYHLTSAHAGTPPVLPAPIAEEFGRLEVLYNDRICPMQTYAIDFTKKLTGKTTYQGLTAEQVLTGCLFFTDAWMEEPFLRIKSGALKETWHLSTHESPSRFFTPTEGYLLGPLLQRYYDGSHASLHKQAATIDNQLSLLMSLHELQPLKVFPYTHADGTVNWYGPRDLLPADVDSEHKKYITQVFSLLQADVSGGHYDRVRQGLEKMQEYQAFFGSKTLPSPLRLKSERIYNQLPIVKLLFMLNLTLGLLALVYLVNRLATKERHRQRGVRIVMKSQLAVLALSWTLLTLCEALRWIIGGRIPLSNGYETMLLMSWMVLLAGLLFHKKSALLPALSLTSSGFFLLVAHISDMDPHITPLMPVLSSPLLTIHVSVIMLSYALLTLTFVCGVTALVLHLWQSRQHSEWQVENLFLLSRIFLYPSLSTLSIGIFTGAIWANVS